MSVTTMLVLIALIGMLGVLEIGYLYWAKRDAQKVADLAALAGAQSLDLCNATNTDNSAARGNAMGDNRFSGTLRIDCGHWRPDVPMAARFVQGDAALPVNAVRVTASRSVVPFFGIVDAFPSIDAVAIARHSAPVVAFSAGARLLDVDCARAPLQGLLMGLGVDLCATSVGTYEGLANLEITPRGLLDALGIPLSTDLNVGSLNGLLSDSSVALGDLLTAMTSLADAQGVAGVRLDLLRSELARAGLDQARIRLGSDDAGSGLFANIAATGSAGSALDARLDALDVLGAAISVGTGRNAIQLSELNIAGIQAEAAIVEPASLGIGAAGTTAYNAQIRLKLDIDSDRILVAGSLFKLLGTRLHLPIYIDVVNGFAQLRDIDCQATPSQATFDVTSSIANICIGQPLGDWASLRTMCPAASGLPATLADTQLVRLFGADVLTDSIALPALRQTRTIVVPEGGTVSVAPNTLAIGTLLDGVSDALFDTLDALFQPDRGSADTLATATSVANRYLDATKRSDGFYDVDAAIAALKTGTSDLGALGTWTTTIPNCNNFLGLCTATQGDVWTGFKTSTQAGGGLLSGLLGSLGITACNGLVAGLLNYNGCVRNNLARYLQTRPGGLEGLGYDPRTGTGACSGVLCAILRPVVANVLAPALDALGDLLANALTEVMGLELGRTDVHVQSIQCRTSQLVQ